MRWCMRLGRVRRKASWVETSWKFRAFHLRAHKLNPQEVKTLSHIFLQNCKRWCSQPIFSPSYEGRNSKVGETATSVHFKQKVNQYSFVFGFPLSWSSSHSKDDTDREQLNCLVKYSIQKWHIWKLTDRLIVQLCTAIRLFLFCSLFQLLFIKAFLYQCWWRALVIQPDSYLSPQSSSLFDTTPILRFMLDIR